MPANIANQVFLAILPWILLVGLVSILITVFRIFFLPRLKGRLGEASINFRTQRLLDQTVYHLIPNVMLTTPDGTTQIDHVIVSMYGIFVIETKTYKGWIYGDEREAKWTQAIYHRKEQFQNPLRQNKAPVAANAGTPVCPRCGEVMVLRTRRKDGSQFWGCSAYPKCKGIKQVA
ncbi:MAG: NERD domain-containing protein [Lentisphaerae bacterium]|nr:NERD domain-containing protein [Lentisphaerota bacterium]